MGAGWGGGGGDASFGNSDFRRKVLAAVIIGIMAVIIKGKKVTYDLARMME